MSMNEAVKAALITLGLKDGVTISEIREKYLEKTGQERFQRIILTDEKLKREFSEYYKAYVELLKYYHEDSNADMEYYPPDQVFQFHFNQGLAHALNQNYIKAGEKFQEAYQVNNQDILVLLYLGYLLLKRKNYYAAEKYFKDVVKLDSHCEDGWFYLGECYYRAGDQRKALNMYETARALDAQHPELSQRIRELKEKVPGAKRPVAGKPSFWGRLIKRLTGK